MALTRFSTEGYGQVELNQVAFRRDGRIEAQCALAKETDTKDGFSKKHPAENGMILAIDKAKNEVKLPESTDKLFALNYTTEHMYDERANALKDFSLIPGTFYPRMGYLAKGDRFTTNTICYDDETYDDNDAIKTAMGAGKVYATVCTSTDSDSSYAGLIQIVGSYPESPVGPVLEAVKYYTMPDGSDGIKFLVIED